MQTTEKKNLSPSYAIWFVVFFCIVVAITTLSPLSIVIAIIGIILGVIVTADQLGKHVTK